ncbi:MAG: HEAT repeat domain-containing protein [Planctomycetota bacterium]
MQGFSIFGYSVFTERGGRDTYRCAAMGQGCASTLGVTILAEGGGDDTYRAGGKYGFYVGWDSSCAQGAASGMRPWPPTGKLTVYGGVALLSEAGGNDTYHCYNIGQGGSYIFALGMLVDSAGDDTYTGKNYTRGVGVHLSAAICIDKAGNDLHLGDYGQNGMSLDRASSVFIDLAGDDLYRCKAGLGFSTKPRGCAIFVEAAGNDIYGGPGRFFGYCNVPFGDDAESSAFFFDFGGKDTYPAKAFKNDATWKERAFGVGEDSEIAKPTRGKEAWWAPAKPVDPKTLQDMPLDPHWTLERFWWKGVLMGRQLKDLDDKNWDPFATSPVPFLRKDLIDIVRVWLLEKKIAKTDGERLGVLLSSEDRDLRILGLHVLGELKVADEPLILMAGLMSAWDPSPDVRGMACLALGRSGSDLALPWLKKGLFSPFWAVRRRAARGLTALKTQGAREELLSILKGDPEPAVRGRAAEALGAGKDPEAIPALNQALLDPAELVRFFAAQALLKDFGKVDAMEHFFPLMRWKVGPQRDRLLGRFLKAYTGQALPMKEKAWKRWWSKAGRDFDGEKHAKIFALYEEAQKKSGKGDEDGALALYREIRKLVPKHAGACEELSNLLNSRAWGIAVAGGDYTKGLKLAQESVDAKPGANNLDTLAVLQFLTGDHKTAIETLTKALKTAKGRDAELFRNRLEEFKNEKLNLR